MEDHDIEVKAIIDATKATIGGDEALALALQASAIHVAKGKKRLDFTVRAGKPSGEATQEDIRAAITGPTGNLRAPTLFVGKSLYVGFNDELYADLLG